LVRLLRSSWGSHLSRYECRDGPGSKRPDTGRTAPSSTSCGQPARTDRGGGRVAGRCAGGPLTDRLQTQDREYARVRHDRSLSGSESCAYKRERRRLSDWGKSIAMALPVRAPSRAPSIPRDAVALGRHSLVD
jgi:hypothetical protein